MLYRTFKIIIFITAITLIRIFTEDSGADVNLMDEFHFSNLRKLSGNKLKLEKSKVELSTLQRFLSTLRLLGFANEPSGLICIIPHSRSVALLKNGSEFIFPFITMNLTEILDEFGSVFEGIGKIRDNKNDSEREHRGTQ
jgi:hypothetical protein